MAPVGQRPDFVPVEVQPGLVIRHMEPHEFDMLVDAIEHAPLRVAPSEETARRWINDMNSWNLVTVWKGEPLQFQRYKFQQEPRDTRIAIVGYTYHKTRERLWWFWRECERPVYQQLINRGVTKGLSWTRADKPDWVDILRAVYGARIMGTAQEDKWVSIEWDFAEAWRRSPGYPNRVTIPGWSHESNGVLVREARAEDIPDLPAQLDAIWRPVLEDGRVRQQYEIAKRMLMEWWELDMATLLLGYEHGELRHVRAVRWRRPEVSSIGFLTPIWNTAQAMTDGVLDWHKQAGYFLWTMFVPEWQWEHMRVQKFRDPYSPRWVRDWNLTQPFVEIEGSVPD